MTNDFKLTAQIVVDQHHAAGPDRMKQVLAQALAEAAAPAKAPGSPREQLR